MSVVKIYDMRQKEVINIRDGCRFGFICDMVIDVECGSIVALIVPGPGRVFGMFGRDQEYYIPWKHVCKIGDDIILVDVDTEKALRDCED